MKKYDHFLIEIGTEELPTQAVKSIPILFATQLKELLTKENFAFADIKLFSTPRRIAVLIENVESTQKDKLIERKGPSLNAALDQNHSPTPAGLGFARSCGVEFSALEIEKSGKNAWLVYRHQQKGKTFIELAPTLVHEALKSLPMGKTMRWNSSDIEFLRPVHWVLMMYGNTLIQTEILGLSTSNHTFGHRFHHPDAIPLTHASEYESLLENKGKVIPSFDKRKAAISNFIEKMSQTQNGQAIFNKTLLDEVTSLVEWPIPYIGTYAEDFLALPKEVLISAMEQHQKCFPIENKANKLKPCFIAIGNIESQNPEQVVIGNERVMRARLSDAAFFFYTDKKQPLESYLEALKKVTFQTKLGSLFEKANRIAVLSSWIIKEQLKQVDLDSDAQRAGLLAKTDLVTNMVYEFPELQGIMGYYYALHSKENNAVATAIREHYLPRFSGDKLPTTLIGSTLAIADRIDSLVGMFSLNKAPSGDKDPFGLKRAAMGIARIIIENALPLSLNELIEQSIEIYGSLIKNQDFKPILKEFIIERLRTWYYEKGIPNDSFNAVIAIQNDQPLDIHHRIIAVEHFRHLPEAEALTSANKRVNNLLNQAEFNRINIISESNPNLFETNAEKNLHHQIKQLQKMNNKEKQDYATRLAQFSALRPFVDSFFDDVMVMVEEEDKRNNRLQLLAQLRGLFLQIADISILQI